MVTLQNFVDKRLPVVSADWLNSVDYLKVQYDRTDAEAAAGITLTAPFTGYAPGNVKRYGAAVDGVTDDRAAIMKAYAAFKQGNPPPFWNGTCLVLQSSTVGRALDFDTDVVLYGQGNMTLKGDGVNNYSLLYCSGSGRVDIQGVIFDGGKNAPITSGGGTNIDILLRVQGGTYTTVNVQNCTFRNYNGSGIYSHAAYNSGGAKYHHNSFYNGAGYAISLDRGQYVEITDNIITGILLQPINVATNDNVTTMRAVTIARNTIIGGGTATDAVDRAGIFLSHKLGAAAAVMGQYVVADNVIKDFGVGYGGGALVLGIETREATDVLVTGNMVTGINLANGIGLYSFQTTRASYIGNQSSGNNVGLNMNQCTDYTEKGNLCFGNTTWDRDYHGPTAASTFVEAEGLRTVFVWGVVSIAAGVATLSQGYNVASVSRTALGVVQITLSTAMDHTNYDIQTSTRATGQSSSSTYAASTFNVNLTDSAGAPADVNFNFTGISRMNKTNPPP